MQKFISLAGGKDDARILIFTTASPNPEKDGEELVEEFKNLGIAASRLKWIAPEKEECDKEETLSVFDGVTGIYFCGGSQRRILRTLYGTLVHNKLKQMYEAGAVIGGTSAGAAMMSVPMITGKRTDHDSEKGFKWISKGMVEISDGMGFLGNNILIDQHFIKRGRENRLFSAVLDNPELKAIGIDESTAVVVSDGCNFEVVGDSNVMVVEPDGETIRTDANGNYGADLKIRLLISGDRFSIVR